MKIKHIELNQANAFVDIYHKHHKKVTGHRFLSAVNLRKEL